MWDLLLYTSDALAFKSLSWGLSKFFSVKILNFTIILKINYRLSLVYFNILEVAQMGLELKKLIEGPKELEDCASLLFILETIEMSL